MTATTTSSITLSRGAGRKLWLFLPLLLLAVGPASVVARGGDIMLALSDEDIEALRSGPRYTVVSSSHRRDMPISVVTPNEALAAALAWYSAQAAGLATTASDDASYVSRSRSFDGITLRCTVNRGVQIVELNCGRGIHWRVRNGRWDSDGVSRRQLAYVLRRLERSAFVIRQVTASAPDRTASETTERLLCKLGLQSRALSGCNPDAPLQFTIDITSRYHSGWTARVADAHDDTVCLLSGTVYR